MSDGAATAGERALSARELAAHLVLAVLDIVRLQRGVRTECGKRGGQALLAVPQRRQAQADLPHPRFDGLTDGLLDAPLQAAGHGAEHQTEEAAVNRIQCRLGTALADVDAGLGDGDDFATVEQQLLSLVAVDGEPVQPLPGSRFGVAMGQRLDIELDVPGEGGAFPILALREGAKERTGVILATPGAAVTRIAEMSEADHPAFSGDLAQEGALRAVTPLPERAPASQPMLMLGGTMMPYVWTINGQTWGSHVPVTAKSGDRVEIMFHNMSMMAHPMHLHGHAFQVVGVGMDRIAGAVRDTVHVPPMGMVTVAVDAGEAARWMLHCHHMPHLSTGMMTEFAVSA